jgi:hypothetical protein
MGQQTFQIGPSELSKKLWGADLNLPAKPTEAERKAYDKYAKEEQKKNSPLWHSANSIMDAIVEGAKGVVGLNDPSIQEGESKFSPRRIGGLLGEISSAGLPFSAYKMKWLKEGKKVGVLHGTPNVVDKFDFSRTDNSDLLGSMAHGADAVNPDYSSSYSGLHPGLGGMKRSGDGRPNIIAMEPKAQNVLDVTQALSPDDLAAVIAAAPSEAERRTLIRAFKRSVKDGSVTNPYSRTAQGYSSPESYVQSIVNENRDIIGKRSTFDAFKHFDANKQAWAIPETTGIQTPWGVPIHTPKGFEIPIPQSWKDFGVGKSTGQLPVVSNRRPDYHAMDERSGLLKAVDDLYDSDSITSAQWDELKKKIYNNEPLFHPKTGEMISTKGLINTDKNPFNSERVDWTNEDMLNGYESGAKKIVDEIIKPGDTIEDLPGLLKHIQEEAKKAGWSSSDAYKIKQQASEYLTSKTDITIAPPSPWEEPSYIEEQLKKYNPYMTDVQETPEQVAKKVDDYFANFPANVGIGKSVSPSSNVSFLKDLGGSHGAKLIDFGNGPEVFKPGSGLPVLGENFGSRIANLINKKTPITENIWSPKFGDGTVQKYMQDYLPLNPKELNEYGINELRDELPIDWLIGNHDAHKGQFLMPYDGGSGIIPIDKGQSFKHWNTEILDPDYHPNAKYGEQPPIYSQIGKSIIPKQAAEQAEYIRNTYGDQIKNLAEQYGNQRLKIDPDFSMSLFMNALESKLKYLPDDIKRYWQIARDK